jgi:hypothetical protein
MKKLVRNQKGQVILVLLLIMTVALAIGLSVVQRSIKDVSTSTKVEESARAFSAAEAGIERALNCTTPPCTGFSITDLELNNFSAANISGYAVPDANTKAFEIPTVTQEKPGQLWLANPDANFSNKYGGGFNSQLDVFWADDNVSPNPAIEITVVYNPSAATYTVNKFFYDSVASRRLENNFSQPISGCRIDPLKTHISPNGRSYENCTRINLTANPILLRARLIYAGFIEHPVAFEPVGSNTLVQQGTLFISTGTSGETKRTIVLQRQDKVLPFFFDFVLYSLKVINKP